jgi:CubicO group peptidase (beta-lactamase class C family)
MAITAGTAQTATSPRSRHGKHLRRGLAVLSLALLTTLAIIYRPSHAVRVATGVVAHDVCSKTFISGMDPALVMAETVTRPGIRWLTSMLDAKIDTARKTVSASFAGLFASRAVFRDGTGCVLVHTQTEPYSLKVTTADLKAAAGRPLLPPIAGSAAVVAQNAKLQAAVDGAFTEPSAPPLRLTKAVVIVHDGQIVAERYAPGIGIDTPLMGFSMTKTVVNAMLGILVHQGRLKTSDIAPIAEWRDPADPRRSITIEHLMRMSSGLDLDETNSGFDRSSRNLYLESDTVADAAKAKLLAAPGTRFAYSSPSTILLARIIRDAVGGKPEQVLEFAWRELFGPLGMQHVTVEFDAAGNFLGSSYMFASARDWARFGTLYLRDGMAGSRRLLPEGWVDFSARSTLGTYYGAGLWTLRSDHAWSKRWAEMGIPSDAFFATGSLGQRIIVLPTQRLVIVRLGDAVDPTGDMQGVARLVRETVAALTP